jgi:hypothetical protein
MKDIKTKERFVELRAQGKSYADIAAELGTSKPTLIAWSKHLQQEIANLRTIEWEAIYQKCLVAKDRRIAIFGKMLEKVVAEIEKRELSDVDTSKLFEIALKYTAALKTDDTGLVFRGTESAMQFELEKEVSWSA